VTRPRAADDFATIRARMEELQRERGQLIAENQQRPATAPRPSSLGSRPDPADKPRLLHPILRALMRAGTS
jgi:hypothetical protein